MMCTEATSCTLCVPGFIKEQNGLCKNANQEAAQSVQTMLLTALNVSKDLIG